MRRQQLPTWVEEGLAAYFTYWFWAYQYGVDELARMQEVGRWVPLQQLLGESVEDYAADEHARFVELGCCSST